MVMANFLALPKDIQKVISMKYYENRISNAWIFKINDSKVVIEVEAQEIWME